MKRSIEVVVFGQMCRVLTDDEEHVRRLAAFVDAKMHEAMQTSTPADTLRVAILAALNIADECHRLRREQDEMVEHIERISRGLVEISEG
jgi:cell division protein ZapA